MEQGEYSIKEPVTRFPSPVLELQWKFCAVYPDFKQNRSGIKNLITSDSVTSFVRARKCSGKAIDVWSVRCAAHVTRISNLTWYDNGHSRF